MDDRQRVATMSSFRSMHARCADLTNPTFKYYAGKGIKVCDRWSVFENFLEDMGHRPEGKTLDRIDGNKGYCKENCRWATNTEQRRNLSSNKLSFDTAVEVAIRRLRGERCEDIAALYEIGKSMPRDIVKGRAWHDAVETAKKIIEIGNAAMDKELQRLRNLRSSAEYAAIEASGGAPALDDATVDMWMSGIGAGVWIDRKLTLRPDEVKSVIRGIAALADKRAALARAPLPAQANAKDCRKLGGNCGCAFEACANGLDQPATAYAPAQAADVARDAAQPKAKAMYGTIGHIDHGKTALTAAIATALSKKFETEVGPVAAMSRTNTEKGPQ